MTSEASIELTGEKPAAKHGSSRDGCAFVGRVATAAD
jgi:hypothetical protein